MKMLVLILDDNLGVLASSVVNKIPVDLKRSTDPFIDLEGRLREVAGDAAYEAHQKATAPVA